MVNAVLNNLAQGTRAAELGAKG